MALVRWPTDPPGKKPSHTISWQAEQRRRITANRKTTPPTPAQNRAALLPPPKKGSGPAKGIPTPPPPLPVTETPAPGAWPMPVDPLYDDDVERYRQRRDTDQSAATGERTSGLLDYGFTENPATKALAFDPNNPFSRAALLKKNYDTSRRATGQSMASGGQLYSGAYQNAQDLVNRNQLGADDSLQKSLISFLSGNTTRYAKAGTDFEFGVGRAAGDRAARALNNPLYSPTAAAAPKPAAKPAAVPAVKPAPTRALVGNTLTAAPGLKGVKKTRKGNTVTYTASVKRP